MTSTPRSPAINKLLQNRLVLLTSNRRRLDSRPRSGRGQAFRREFCRPLATVTGWAAGMTGGLPIGIVTHLLQVHRPTVQSLPIAIAGGLHPPRARTLQTWIPQARHWPVLAVGALTRFRFGAFIVANPEHLSLVTSGPEAFTRWREENPDTVLDLVGG